MSREKYIPDPAHDDLVMRDSILDDRGKFSDILACELWEIEDAENRHTSAMLELMKSRECGDKAGMIKAANDLCDMLAEALDFVSISDADYQDFLDSESDGLPPGWMPSLPGRPSSFAEYACDAVRRGDGY